MAVYPELSGRIVLVTGGAMGIGEAHVKAFAAQGARVAFLDIQDEPAGALVSAIQAGGGSAVFKRCDLTDLGQLTEAIEEIVSELGAIHTLVSNAAVDQRHGLADFDEEAFTFMMNVNLRHVMFAAQKVAPHMMALGEGAIINTSSVAWMRGVADLMVYSAAKAGIVGFTNALARELGRHRIRVNTLMPGFVPTPRQEKMWISGADYLKTRLERQCLPDVVTPEDVANAAVFLASDSARMITKHCLVVNAGSH